VPLSASYLGDLLTDTHGRTPLLHYFPFQLLSPLREVQTPGLWQQLQFWTDIKIKITLPQEMTEAREEEPSKSSFSASAFRRNLSVYLSIYLSI